MDDIPLSSCLEADPRPSCLIDLGLNTGVEQHRPSVVYKNKALEERSDLLASLEVRETNCATTHQLPEWCYNRHFAGQVPVHIGSFLHTHVISDRWRLVQWDSGTKHQQSSSLALEDTPANRENAVMKLHNLHKMMESVNVGMFEYDQKGVLVWGNDAFYRLSGHPRKSTKKDKTWQETVFSEDYEWLLGQWKMMASGEPITIEMKWKRPASAMPNGEEDTHGQWVLATCQPTFDAAGAVTSVSGCLTDIAAQKRTQRDASRLRSEAVEKLQVSEQNFSNFVESARVGIWMMDADKKLQYANPEWFALTGHRKTPFHDVDWSSCVDGENLEVVDHHLDEILRTNQRGQFQLELLRTWENDQGGTLPVNVMVSAFPEIDARGSVTGIAGTIADVTHLRWAEQLQKQRTNEAIEAKRQQENFIDMTCHEIRNPLGAVVQCVDVIRATLEDMSDLAREVVRDAWQSAKFDDLFASTTENIEILTACCDHQKRIVDDILTVSKLDSNLLTVAPAPARLEDLLLQTSNLFQADARKADVALRTIRQPSLGEIIANRDVVVDAGRLLQVLFNLITNALKFTQREKGKRSITLTVGASRDQPSEQALGVEFLPAAIAIDRRPNNSGPDKGKTLYLHFQVTDTGCGFGSDEKLRIFERFEQASIRTHSRYGGSGLGLFISREMVELHGGKIGVASQPGKGSTFAFYIASHTIEPQRPVGSKPDGMALRPKKSVASPEHPYSILIVEDNLTNQKVLRTQLQRLGHRVYAASNGVEALDFLQTTSLWAGNASNQPDISVILMDLEMPLMGGIECTQQIRKSQADGKLSRHVPIIAVSANARDAQVNDALESGMDSAISKPFRVADLMPKIEALVK